MILSACIMMLGVSQIFAGVEHRMASPVRLSRDGRFLQTDGTPFIPLGGFHGNVMPMSLLELSEDERREFEPNLWQGHLDLFDAPESVLQQWFQYLAENGVTSLRLFPRARVGMDVLDLCGEVNAELQAAFHRAFAAAEPYNIRFLLQIMPEPGRTGYINRRALESHVLPRFTQEEMENLTPAQKRFIIDNETVKMAEYFTDPDVLACQKLYLKSVLEWVADEPQIFALEIYNEQGWGGARIDDKWQQVFTYPWEDAEIRWTGEIVRAIKERLPEMPVCLSHPGFGITGFDPLKWSQGAEVDFYSQHLYAGLCGAGEDIDFAPVTAATAAIISARFINFPGEWGILNSKAPEAIRRRNHRDAIWLNMMTGGQGFMQWEYDFPEEYHWVNRIFQSLPVDFSPEPPDLAVEIGQAYRDFQTNTRYLLFSEDQWFSSWEFNRQKQADENIRKIFAAYQRSLELGVPIRFVMDQDDAMPLEQFLLTGSDEVICTSATIRAPGGYQLAYIRSNRIWVGYLRSRGIEKFNGHFLGVPTESPLNIRLNLPEGQYTVRVINLETDEIQKHSVTAPADIHVASETSDDYVLVITDAGVKLSSVLD